jgi:hypothetical protein
MVSGTFCICMDKFIFNEPSNQVLILLSCTPYLHTVGHILSHIPSSALALLGVQSAAQPSQVTQPAQQHWLYPCSPPSALQHQLTSCSSLLTQPWHVLAVATSNSPHCSTALALPLLSSLSSTTSAHLWLSSVDSTTACVGGGNSQLPTEWTAGGFVEVDF